MIPRIKITLAAGFVASLLCASGAAADVLHAERDGFIIRIERSVVAPPDTAWRMLVGHVAEWWHSDHTYSGNAENLYIEARPLGCFCERLNTTDAVVHMTVTAIQENALLRLTGGLGPLGLMGVAGNMTFSIAPGDTATSLALEYRVGGYHPGGLDAVAAAVDATLAEQLDRYVRFVESGSPEPPPEDGDLPNEGMPSAPEDLQG